MLEGFLIEVGIKGTENDKGGKFKGGNNDNDSYNDNDDIALRIFWALRGEIEGPGGNEHLLVSVCHSIRSFVMITLQG